MIVPSTSTYHIAWPRRYLADIRNTYKSPMPYPSTCPPAATTNVYFFDLREVNLPNQKMNGLELKFKVYTQNDELMFFAIQHSKDKLLYMIKETIAACNSLQVQAIIIHRGSIEIAIILGAAATWVQTYATIISTITPFFGLYQPAKEIIKDVKAVIPKLTANISGF